MTDFIEAIDAAKESIGTDGMAQALARELDVASVDRMIGILENILSANKHGI